MFFRRSSSASETLWDHSIELLTSFEDKKVRNWIEVSAVDEAKNKVRLPKSNKYATNIAIIDYILFHITI